MQRIHFTAADLARTRLTPTLGPAAETIFALSMLGGPGRPRHAPWSNGLSRRLHGRSELIDPLIPPQRRLDLPADLLCLLDRGEAADDSALRALQLSRRRVLAGLHEVWRLAIAPSWEGIHAQLETECTTRGRIVMTGGVEQLLATLHPRIVWRAPVLEVPGDRDADIHLDGAGLRLCPSFFLSHQTGVVIDADRESGETVLVFAAVPNSPQAIDLWDVPGKRVQALGALVGRTRAAALRELTVARTTGQLADRLGISSAGASQHAAVLRGSGLITSRRLRNTVLHTATPLGMALLGSEPQK